MNLILFDLAELAGPAGGQVELASEDRRARHLVEVLRIAPGQVVRAGLVGGGIGRAEVLAVEGGGPGQGGPGSAGPRVRLRVELEERPAVRPPVDLLLAVPRPKALARVLETAAAFGVGRIDLTRAWRVDPSYLDSPRLTPDRMAADLRRGCEQGVTTWLPELAVHRRLMPLLCAPPASWGQARVKLVAHPRAEVALEDVVGRGAAGPVVAAIGPEGGWIDRELDSLAGLGFAPVRLGPAILRVESAVTALLAQLDLLRRL